MNEELALVIKKKNRIIRVLSVTLIASILLLLRYDIHDFFVPSPPYSEGDIYYQDGAKKYRWKLLSSRTPYGSWYDTGSFNTYINKSVPLLIKNMQGKPGYKWGIGFYFMKKKMPNGDRVWDFCMIPTLRKNDLTNPSDSTVLDFFADSNCTVYSRPGCTSLKNGATMSPGNGNLTGYDAGQLWP